jgi:hypothetical protein
MGMSTCPSCNSPDAYVGILVVECPKGDCQHFSEKWVDQLLQDFLQDRWEDIEVTEAGVGDQLLVSEENGGLWLEIIACLGNAILGQIPGEHPVSSTKQAYTRARRKR